jgi:hypothetical protein
MLLVAICIIIAVILIGGYWYYNWGGGSASNDIITLIDTPTAFKGDYEMQIDIQERVVNRKSLLKDGTGYGITMILDMYISNNNSNQDWASRYSRMKPIISIDDSIILMYNPQKGRMYLMIKYRATTGDKVFSEIDLGMIPLQKWSQHVIMIGEQNIDYARDGKLIKNKPINFIPIIQGYRIILGKKANNFHGKIRLLHIIPYPQPQLLLAPQ